MKSTAYVNGYLEGYLEKQAASITSLPLNPPAAIQGNLPIAQPPLGDEANPEAPSTGNLEPEAPVHTIPPSMPQMTNMPINTNAQG